MKVLFGMLPPDAGAIVFRGRELSGHRPRDAMAAGIAMIHQHFMLIDAMTVVENVMLGWPEAGRVLDTAGDVGAHSRGEPALRSRPRSRCADRHAAARPPPARRDPQGDPQRRRAADPRRADLKSGADRGRRSADDPSPAARRGQGHRLHQPQAARSARALRRGRRAARRPRRRPRNGRRHEPRRAGGNDGRPCDQCRAGACLDPRPAGAPVAYEPRRAGARSR